MSKNSDSKAVNGGLTAVIRHLEAIVFRRGKLILALLALFTLVMGWYGSQLRMEAGFEKQLPVNHPYIKAYEKYRGDVIGANRLSIVVHAKNGTIWTKEGLSRLYSVTQAVMFLPNITRLEVQSLWTPNTYVNEITESGFRADPVIPESVIPQSLTPDAIARIRDAAREGGYIGTLVGNDQKSAMITAEVHEYDAAGKRIDYVAYHDLIEKTLRQQFADKDFQIEIIGFAEEVGAIAQGARNVLLFCGISLLLTVLAVFWYCRSVRLTVLAIACSLTSLIWQFGTLHLIGYGLDPLAVLIPFLIFAIGVSHGVQQINYIVREIAHGKTTAEAARASFTGLLIPGVLALVTAFVSFITLALVPIEMVRELAITASIGVGYKIVTNLIMLPLAASMMSFDSKFAERAMQRGEQRAHWLRWIALLAKPRNAAVVLMVAGVVVATAAWQGRDRVIGTLQPGAPELRVNARYNLDAASIAGAYDTGQDWLTVFVEAQGTDCSNVNVGLYVDQFSTAMRHVPGVVSVRSYSDMLKIYNMGYNEGNPKMAVVPTDQGNYASLSEEISRARGYMNKTCSMVAANLYLTDHKATTINHVIDSINGFAAAHPSPDAKVLLGAGNAGIQAAVNDAVAHSELPMMLYVYGAIIVLVLVVYRDLRAVVACCLPLSAGSLIGYWFMKEFQIGLTVATLPVMVLAVGIGVDYAFYIYNRLQLHLSHGMNIVKALEKSILEVGMATIFTALTLAVGVATWSFSELKFQADMGKLLAIMFGVNLVMAMTVLPALAVWLERIFPRRKAVSVPGILTH
jgi:uncharacterized protein